MADQSPKTPTKVQRIPRDESFKTCKTDMPTPKTRRQLRMTPARNSILSGGKPYKEVSSSSKKFNSRRKHTAINKGHNDTGESNETFIRCEQECLFDRDSLEMDQHKLSSTPKSIKEATSVDEKLNEVQNIEQKLQEVSIEPLAKQPTFLRDQNHNNRDNVLKNTSDVTPKAPNPSPIKEKALSPPKRRDSIMRYLQKVKTPGRGKKHSPPKKNLHNKKNTLMPPPPIPASNMRSNAKTNRSAFVTPKISFRKPASLMSTASRYLSSCNTSRLTRTQSFKSTAELERDYFSSLRSF